MRRRVVCDLDWVMTDTDDEEADERLDVDIHARAHLEMACSRPAEIAPSRPPKAEEDEEDEENEENEEDEEDEEDELVRQIIREIREK